MRSRAYVETSIPSFYFETRPEAEMVARRGWTREWWARASDTGRVGYESGRRRRTGEGGLSVAAGLPALAIESAVLEIVAVYIRHQVMPADPAGDALHLALASYHRCDFLVTWNCKHLANANKFGHIRRVNSLLGLLSPSLVTPLEMLGGNDDQG